MNYWTKVVAPFTGAWIEIGNKIDSGMQKASLPSRERGLKSEQGECSLGSHQVAPFTGAWIEIDSINLTDKQAPVAPFTGAWIEISVQLL